MMQTHLKSLSVSALLLVGVACGKESASPEEPCTRDCPRDSRQGRPETLGAKKTGGLEHEPPMSLPLPQKSSLILERAGTNQGAEIPFQPLEGSAFLKTLQEGCQTAGGTFTLASLDCACPEASKGAVFSTKTKSCVVPVREETCRQTGETFTAALRRKGTEGFLEGCLSNIQTFQGTTFSIEVPSKKAERALEVARFLDAHPAARALRGAAPSLWDRGESWTSKFIVVYGPTPLDERLLETSPYNWDPNLRLPQTIQRAVHIPEEAGLAALFQAEGTLKRPTSELLQTGEFNTSAKPILEPLLNAASKLQDPAKESVIAPELAGCEQVCLVRTEWASGVDGRKIWRDRHFVWGRLFSDTLSIGKNDLSVEARLVFGLDGALSVLEVREAHLSEGNLQRSTRVFDAKGKFLGKTKDDLSLAPLASLQATRGLASAAADTPVVVCDNSFFTGEKNEDFTQNVLFGPFAAQDPFGKGSLFGWEANASASLGLFLGGYAQAPISAGVTGDGFSAFLAGPLDSSGERRVRLIPVASSRCKPGSALLKSIEEETKGKARVVAAFTSALENASDCKAAYGKALAEGSQLWVVTAGNSGLEGRTNFRCPQALGPSNNLVVVGADLPNLHLGGGRLVAPADWGKDYMDLTVVTIDQQSATAIAARTAATLQAAHGATLSNALLRQALLLSVDLPKTSQGAWAPYSSRSAGSLNSERALKAAAFMATTLTPEQRKNFGFAEAKRVIEHLFTDAAEGEYRLKLVTERQGFQP